MHGQRVSCHASTAARLPHRLTWRNLGHGPRHAPVADRYQQAPLPRPFSGLHSGHCCRAKGPAYEGSLPPDDPVAEEPAEVGADLEGDERAQLAIEALQLGSWRLRGRMDAPFEALAAQIEGMWRSMLPDLGLYPLPKEFKYCDSMDPKGEYGRWAYEELSDPERGAKGYPRLQIENRCYSSRVFRKLHLELSCRQDGLQVLHCVMYPKANFDLPILSMDLVGKEGDISLGIIDPCPATMDRALPPIYAQAVQQLQLKYNMVNNRSIPDWGASIFSEACVIIRPGSQAFLSSFIKYAIALTRVHLRMSLNATPVQASRQQRLKDIERAHKRYCDNQLQNDKTRRILEKGFGADFADQFMKLVLFDHEPAVAPAGAQA